jgi:hypothetical protein
MRVASDPELLSFAGQLLERHGALVEVQDDRLLGLVPARLARLLELPEEIQLGGEGMPIVYGSPLLDRLISLATSEIPVLYGKLEVSYLKKAGFEQLLEQDVSFPEAKVRVAGRADARTTYMVLVCRYVALSDERKEGLVQVGVHEGTGACIPLLGDLWSEFQPEFFLPGKVPPHFPVRPAAAVSSALQAARQVVELELSAFLESMRRRLRRDVDNTREYYEALKKEMEESLRHPLLTEGQRLEREGKIQDLPQEMARKIEDLRQKYQIQVNITGGAALRFLVPAAQVMVEIMYRKLRRTLPLIWNPITRHLDPLVCESCRASLRRVYLGAEDGEVRLLCSDCGRRR